jgi:tetratricopeptide (TPR) repeat protein
LSTAYDEGRGIVATIANSWSIQLSSMLIFFLWVRQCLIFIVLGLFITLGISYVPSSLHRINHLFPSSFSPRIKTYFSVLSFLSMIAFGVLPFLWVLACIIWRQCGKRDKWITVACCILLVLFPLSVRFEDMLRSSLSPDGTLSLFKKSVEEGYSIDLDKVIRNHAASHGNDYLAQAAAALFAAKKNDMNFAMSAVQKARMLRVNDPVVLLTEGNVDFLAGAMEKAKNAFEACIKQFPDYAQAYFNCGQYYLGTVETIKGMECIDRATKLDPQTINSFIKTNDESSSKKWPRLRQLMPPEYKAAYFWKNVFPRYGGSLATTNTLWGGYFAGVHIAGYCIVSLLVLLLLVIFDVFAWSGNRVRKISLCKLCGLAMCRQCKRGVVCGNCYQALHQIRNENIRQRIIEKILLKNKRIKHCFSYCIDVVFPGCGMAYYATGSRFTGFCFIMVSSIVYATLFSIYFLPFSCPYWFTRGILVPLYFMVPVYNLIFFVRAIIKSRNEFHT